MNERIDQLMLRTMGQLEYAAKHHGVDVSSAQTKRELATVIAEFERANPLTPLGNWTMRVTNAQCNQARNVKSLRDRTNKSVLRRSK